MQPNIYFQFMPHIFAARYDQQVVLLDVLNNQYLSLSEQSGDVLSRILSTSFQRLNNTYISVKSGDSDREALNASINKFIEKNFIESCQAETRKNVFATPLVPVGLSQIEWMPNKKLLSSRITFKNLLKSVFALHKVHKVLQKQHLQGLLLTLKSPEYNNIPLKLTSNEAKANALAYTLDRASIIYPKKTECLPWAGALAHLLLKSDVSFDFVIGIQTLPFYAHAWIEVNGKVVNDNPEIQERLAPILRLSFL